MHTAIKQEPNYTIIKPYLTIPKHNGHFNVRVL